MHIIQLEAENVKRLKAVRIRPAGPLVVIGGNNGQGKSSVLDAIAMALGGARSFPDVPVRVGEEAAQVIIETETLTIRRVIKPDGTHALRITTRDGMRPASPQEMLDHLAGRLTFDPVAFLRLDAKTQRDRLLEILGIDFSAFEREREELLGGRQANARALRNTSAALESMPPVQDAPPELVDMAQLTQRSKAIAERRIGWERLKADAQKAQAGARDAVDEIARVDAMIQHVKNAAADIEKEARADIAGIVAQARAAIRHVRERTAERLANGARAFALQKEKRERAAQAAAEAIAKAEHAAAAVVAIADQQILDEKEERELTAAWESAEVQNQKFQAARLRANIAEQVKEYEAKAKEFEDAIAYLDRKKVEAIEAAKFPVPDLGFGAGGITLKGLPLAQASSAEQLRVAVALAAATNPKLRVMFIRDAAFLDAENLALVGELAAQMDFQIWVERVGTSDPQAIVIEDGEVKQEAPANG